METFQEKLQTLEKQIRKDLPRLLQPTEGCWVFLKGYNNSLFKIVHRRAKEFLVDDYQGHKPRTYENKKFFEWFEIVGHDILLSDVLEWLGKFFYFRINQEGIIYKEFDSYFQGELDRDYIEVGKIDFSKSRLSDQSKELINFLYNLIQKQNESNKI